MQRSGDGEGRYRLWRLCAAVAVVFVIQTMMVPLVPLFSVSLGASPAAVGGIVSAAYLLPLFVALPLGNLVDRWGSRRLLWVGAVGMGAAPALVTAAPGFSTLIAAQVILGTSQVCVIVAAQAYVAALGDGEEREHNFGWYTTFMSGGQLLGPLLAGVIADATTYRTAFGVAASLVAVPLLLLLRLPPGREGALELSRRDRDPVADGGAPSRGTGGRWGHGEGVRDPITAGTRGHWRTLVELLSNPGVRVALLASCSANFTTEVRQAFFPVYLESLRYPATSIGTLISMRAFVSMLVRPFMPQMIRLLGGRGRTLSATVLTASLGLASFGLLTSFIPLALATACIGIGLGISQPLTIVTVADHTDPSRRGLALGLRVTANRLAQLISPLIFGFIVEAAGFRVAFIAAGFFLASMSVLLWRWRQEVEKGSVPRTERSHTEGLSS